MAFSLLLTQFVLVDSEKTALSPCWSGACTWLRSLSASRQGLGFSPHSSHLSFLEQWCVPQREFPKRRKPAATVYYRLIQNWRLYLPLHSPGPDSEHRLMHSVGHRFLSFYYIPWKGKGTNETTFNVTQFFFNVHALWSINLTSRNLS